MKWRKIGRIHKSNGAFPWMLSHSAVPFAHPISDTEVRVFFSSRDARNRSHIAWLDIDIRTPTIVKRLCERPALAPGELGDFDDTGTTMSCIVPMGESLVLYYSGWSLRGTVPFHQAIGRAVAEKEVPDTFRRDPIGPVLERSRVNPLYVTNPFVIQVDDGFRMWHLAALDWYRATGKMDVRYTVRHSFSRDGTDWTSDPGDVIDIRDPSETAIARPCVIRYGGRYHMWFSYRGADIPYRLGHATSDCGSKWTRQVDPVGMNPGPEEWDSEMVAYPHVIEMRDGLYMFYCGNGYSREGFGVAVLDTG
jgi:hypothetical protein